MNDKRFDAIVSTAKSIGGRNVREVGTGGGINAVLWESLTGTWSVFLDPLGDGFVVMKHGDEEAFWTCEAECPSEHFQTANQLDMAMNAVPRTCPGVV